VDEATSARAALILNQRAGNGSNVRALAGGWNEWVKDGNPVIQSTRR
jgi:rhodanese-related sulfurtransferase